MGAVYACWGGGQLPPPPRPSCLSQGTPCPLQEREKISKRSAKGKINVQKTENFENLRKGWERDGQNFFAPLKDFLKRCPWNTLPWTISSYTPSLISKDWLLQSLRKCFGSNRGSNLGSSDPKPDALSIAPLQAILFKTHNPMYTVFSCEITQKPK